MMYHFVFHLQNRKKSFLKAVFKPSFFSGLSFAVFSLTLISPIFAAPKSSKAEAAQTPKALVQSFYDNYASGKTPPDVLDTLLANSTLGFSKLIATEQACIAKTKQVCKLDYDVIVNGQDYETVKFIDSDITKTKNGMTVCANFENIGDKQKVCYRFIQEAAKKEAAKKEKAKADWRIDDVIDYSDGKEFSVRKILTEP